MLEALPPRRQRCLPAPTVDYRTCQHELVDLVAADLTVLVPHHNAANPPTITAAHKLRLMASMVGL